MTNDIDDSGYSQRVTPDVDALFDALKEAEDSRSRRRWGAGRRPSGGAPDGLWSRKLQWCVAAAVTILLAWLTYSRNGWVPLLSYFDLGVHEFGHMLTMWAPAAVVQPAGSVLQVAAPLALGGYFYWRGDRFAVILMIAWAAESLNNVSVYIHDATRMVLPLFGDDGSGDGHDWHNIFTRLGLLESTDGLAGFTRLLSVLLFVAALGLAGWWSAQARHDPTPTAYL